jgi:hypothetical protein
LKTDRAARSSTRVDENESRGREVEHQFARRPQASPSRPSDSSSMAVNTLEWRRWRLTGEYLYNNNLLVFRARFLILMTLNRGTLGGRHHDKLAVATWNLTAISEFPWRQRKDTKPNPCRDGRPVAESSCSIPVFEDWRLSVLWVKFHFPPHREHTPCPL